MVKKCVLKIDLLLCFISFQSIPKTLSKSQSDIILSSWDEYDKSDRKNRSTKLNIVLQFCCPGLEQLHTAHLMVLLQFRRYSHLNLRHLHENVLSMNCIVFVGLKRENGSTDSSFFILFFRINTEVQTEITYK